MKTNLRRFSEMSGYRVHKRDHNVTDWMTRGEDNHIIGYVNDMIINTQLIKAAYLEISLSDDYQKARGKAQNILVPLKLVDIDKDGEEIQTIGIDRHTIETYPVYEGNIITPEYLFKLQSHFDVKQNGRKKEKQQEIPNGDLFPEYPDVESLQHELSRQKLENLELKKKLKVAQAEREIAILERDIAFTQNQKKKIEERMYRKNLQDLEVK